MPACTDSSSSVPDSALAFPRLVRRNLKLKTVSEVSARIIQFLFLIALARILGPTAFAAYSYAFALGFILSQTSGLRRAGDRHCHRWQSCLDVDEHCRLGPFRTLRPSLP